MRIGLGPFARQQPFIDFINNRWRIWTAFNPDLSSGTYYELYPDGTCDCVTVADSIPINIKRLTTGVVSYG